MPEYYIEREALMKQMQANFRQGSRDGCDHPMYPVVEETIMDAPAIELSENAVLVLAGQALGVTPDRLRELAQAEQDGRVVVLPCKVGDMVYMPDYAEIPVPMRVHGISVTATGRTVLHFGGYPAEYAWGDRYGKDWFLTREEAETALSVETVEKQEH